MRIKQSSLLLVAVMTVTSLSLSSCSDVVDNPTVNPQPSGGDDGSFTVRQVPVSRGGNNSGTVTLRFYDDMNGVAYISAADFQKMILPGSSMNVLKTGEDTYLLDNGKATATVNTTDETFTSTDFMAFTNVMSQLWPGMANVYYDGAPYIHYSSMQLTPATSTVTFDMKRYGIDLRGDDGAVYFPFTTLADLYSDLYYHLAAFNGERVFIITDNCHSSIVEVDPDFTQKAFSAEKRSAQQAAYSYGELCFVIDHFYGMPGRSSLESSIKANGLDATLDAIQNGPDVKRLLQSTVTNDYLYGLTCLHMLLDDDGHTILSPSLLLSIAGNGEVEDPLSEVKGQYDEKFPELAMLQEAWYIGILSRGSIAEERSTLRSELMPEGDDYYRKSGNTAYCLYDQFGYTDFDGWHAYYEGKAPMPSVTKKYQGELVVVLDALKRASTDPEVENLVIDLSCNGGGSLDVVMAITSLIGNQCKFYSENTLTGQQQTIYYDMDRNFDGRVDAADEDVSFDGLNVAILTSRTSFSCGNLLPSLMKDMGFLIIGERSGGGACAVQNFCTPEGMQYQISSYRGRLTNDRWQNIDGGIEPNVPITVGTTEDGTLDYSSFYDFKLVGDIISKWYADRK